MKDARDVILAPVITEKSMAATADRKYTFKVAKNAEKVEIAKAVEKQFGVKVAKVNTISMHGRLRRPDPQDSESREIHHRLIPSETANACVSVADGSRKRTSGSPSLPRLALPSR